MAKRALDIIGSLIGLILLAPAFLVIAVLTELDSPGPVFFGQARAGKDGRPFKIWKFRTMVDGAGPSVLGRTTGIDDPRITALGRFLRAWSLDEIPQFFNVLIGDMSLVGPRPALCDHVERHNAYQRRVLNLKPGITSWPGVNGRNLLSWERRCARDEHLVVGPRGDRRRVLEVTVQRGAA